MTHEHDEDDRQRHMARAASIMAGSRMTADLARIFYAQGVRLDWEAFWGEKAREAEAFALSLKYYTPNDVMAFAKAGLTLDRIRELHDDGYPAEALHAYIRCVGVGK